MQITNLNNFPDYLYRFLAHDSYDYIPGTISVTRLLSPPRQYALTKIFEDKLSVDASDLISSRFGTCIHAGFECVPMPFVSKEQRLSHKIKINGEEIELVGKYDMITDLDKPVKKLVDIKSTSVWNYIYGGKDDDYVKQLSVYRYLANKQGIEVGDDAEICMVFTDWSKSKAKSSKGYPKLRVAIKNIKLLPLEETESYIIERLTLFLEALKLKPEELPPCSDEDLWKSDDTWAIVLPMRKEAIRVCNSQQEARDIIKTKKLRNAMIHFRKGKVKRCNYCMCREFCDQYKKLLSERLIEE